MLNTAPTSPQTFSGMPWLSRLSHLPRDARDTLFLLAVMAWVLAPQVAHVPVWCSLLSGGVMLWRAVLAVRGQHLPSRWWLLGLLAVAMAGTALSFGTLIGRDAGVTLIVLLLTLKTLELRARRDAFVVFFLGFFTMLTHFFNSQSLLTAMGMLVGLLGLLTALVNAHMPVGRPPLWRAMRTAGWMALLGLPIMLALFLFFPRLAPLWGIPSDQASGRSGLSGSMQVGGIASLALSDEIAFRVQFQDPVPPARELYWRGPVLSAFDGTEWRGLRVDQLPWLPLDPNLEVAGEPVRYRVTMEPNNRPWIFTLDGTLVPPRRSDGARTLQTHELQWISQRPITDILRYDVQSHVQFRHGPLQAARELQTFVELPPGFNPRTLQLAADIRADPRYAQADALTLTQAVFERLRTGGYRYTLEPGTYGTNAADEFWFDRKLGFCEHIASAFVILMRAMDVPARIVTGYQGGEINPVDRYWTLRQRDAHAWAEVWQAGRGWVRVDPTSAVFPERVGQFQRLTAPVGVVGAALAAVNPNLMAILRNNWEAINNRWNQWVLNYTQSQQLDLLRGLGFSSPTWTELAYVLLGLVVAVSTLGAVWTLLERRRIGPWARLLQQTRKRLAERGLDVANVDTPRSLAQAALLHFGEEARGLHDWLLRLERQRYGEPSQADALTALRREWRDLPWPSARRTGLGQAQNPSPATSGAGRIASWLPSMGLAAVVGAATCFWPAQALAQQTKPHAAKAHKPPKSTASKPTPIKPSAPELKEGPAYAEREDAMRAADDIAERRSLDRDWVRSVIGSARLQPQVTRLVLPPPRGTPKNWAAYRARFIEPRRVAAGVAFWQANREALERAKQTTGVPAELIVGVIGVETLYGRHMGTHRVVDVLATLAFDFPAAHPRAKERQAFFRQELEQFLSLKNRSGMDPASFRGSFAGAMGLGQFMPSSWVRYAVDFDGDGRIDLFNSASDAIGSVANYFVAFQWQPGMPTHYPVTLSASPAQMEQLLAPDILPSFSAARMAELGVQIEGGGAQHSGPLALVELENGSAPPSFVAGTANFYAVTRYNWSSYYAMAVIDLGQAVAREMPSKP